MIIGDKIFSFPHFKEDIILPSTIKVINSKEVYKLSSLTIPTMATSIDLMSLNMYKIDLYELHIPSTIKSFIQSIQYDYFEKCYHLTNISLPLNESQIISGNKIFSIPHFEQLLMLPSDITIINGKQLDKTKFEIPSTVTSFDSHCFKDCYENINHLIFEGNTIDWEIISKCRNLITLKVEEFKNDVSHQYFLQFIK